MARDIDSAVDLGGFTLKNPVIAASGCYNRGAEYGVVVDVSAWGAVTLKSVAWEARLGNEMPRVANTPAGMLNAIGLQGPGIEHFLKTEAPKLADVPTAVIASVAGFTVDEFAAVAARIDGLPNVVAIELDISCPNVESEGGACFAADPEMAAAVIRAVKRRTSLPIVAKLTPNVTDLRPIARSAEAAGANALSLINSVRGMVIDVERLRPMLANGMGGLTGPAIRPIGIAAVWEVAQVVKIPIVGMGGIESGRDALEFMLAGASAVSIGTAVFRDPQAHIHVARSLSEAAARRGLTSVRGLTGLANPKFAAHVVRS